MTVESSSRKQTFAGGQSALTFSFRTLAAHPEYIKVLKTLTATGVDTDLTYLTDYTVSVNADGVGGVVTVSPTFSTAYTMTVYRDTDDLQESDYDDFNQFPADTLEDDLDRRTLISQERAEDSDRTAKLPISSTGSAVLPTPVDGMALVWSGVTGKLINSSLTGATGAIGPSGATGAAGAITSVSSSTSDITVVSTGTTPIITAVNAATAGASKILRLTSAGLLPPLVGSALGRPYFLAVNSGAQALTSGTTYVVTLGTVTLDSDSYFTNSRFTPLVAGKYLFLANIYHVDNDTTTQLWEVQITKNGSAVTFNDQMYKAAGATDAHSEFIMAFVSMNGSTDYAELKVTQTGAGGAARSLHGSAGEQMFAGFLVAI